jgi:hypothetical protein
VSATAAATRPTTAVAWLRRAADGVARHVVVALAAIVGFQILATVALFFSVNANGWLTYQGGDQIWLVTSAWLLGKGTIGYALTGPGWPMLLAPLTWITGSSSVQLLPLTTVLQVAVLAPVATLAVYDIGARVAGRLAGVWCAAAFAVAPFAAIPYFVQRYHDSWVDQFLPQALGLTQQADFPSVVAVLVSVAFTVRAFRAAAYREAVLAGTFAGVALALKPANALFLGGPLVAFALARRWAHLPLFLASLAPALLALSIWKARGLGEVPLFAQGEATRLAAGLGDPVMVSATSWLDRTVRLDLDTWRQNMSNLREFTWSARVLQFLPLAGTIAVARRSVPAAGLLLAWLLGYVVVKGAADVATVESGSFWRLIMPALPAFVLLAAAVPLLVPTFVARMGPRLAPDPGRRPGVAPTAAVVGLLAVVPLAWLVLASQYHVQRNPDGPGYVVPELVVSEIGVPADPDVVSLTVSRVGDANVLHWTDSTTRARTFYRVYRASLSRGFSEMVCDARGVDRCDLRAETLVTTRAHTYVDRDPPADAIYRVGVAANWLDDEERGDVFAISPPAAPRGSPR